MIDMEVSIHNLYDLLEEADEYETDGKREPEPFPRLIYNAYIGEEEK